MSRTYGSTVIPGDEITVQAGGTVPVSPGVARSAVIVGGMDTSVGTATPGDAVRVNTTSEAQDLFGDDSELYEQCRLALLNGVTELHAVPVSETTVTTETHPGQSGTLDNAPVFNPDLNGEHSITVTDSGGGTLTVNIVYDDSPSAPIASDEININPSNGAYNADAAPSGANYEFDYDYGDYSSTTMQTAAGTEAREIIVCSENSTVYGNALSEANANDNDFIFQHVTANAQPVPDSDTSANYATNYSDTDDDFRLSLVAPAIGYVDDAETKQVRLCGVVGAKLASLGLGDSGTNESLAGITGLRTDFAPSEAGDLIDAQVLPVLHDSNIYIVKDMTTSTEPKFERVYAIVIADEVAELSHEVSRNFIGELNTEANRFRLDRNHRTFLREMRDDAPPLLDGFNLTVEQNSSNANQVDIEIGVDIVNVIDTIKVDMLVGDVVTNGGLS